MERQHCSRGGHGIFQRAGRTAAVIVLITSFFLFLPPSASASPLDPCQRDGPAGSFYDEVTVTGVGTYLGNLQPTLIVQPGDAVLVRADPATKVTTDQWPWSTQYTAAGDARLAGNDFPVPGAPRYGLIGGAYNPPTGRLPDPMYLGMTSCHENNSDTSWDFRLSINDTNLFDNDGGWRVTVRVYQPAVRPRSGHPFDPSVAVNQCKTGGTPARVDDTYLNGAHGWKPITFTLQPGAVYRAEVPDSVYYYETAFGPMPGGTTPPRIKIGPWPWDPSYGPDGAGWSARAPSGWPAPGLPEYGLIAAWEGLPGYYWIGSGAPCVQWTGSQPVTVTLTMNDPNISDNSGGWEVKILYYSPYA